MASNDQSHALLIPFPFQGHVTPLKDLAHRLANAGVLVTFVNTERVHAQIMAAHPTLERQAAAGGGKIHMVSIPDGLRDADAGGAGGQNGFGDYLNTIHRTMPLLFEELLLRIDAEKKITWVIADGYLSWLLCVAKKHSIRVAAFWAISAFSLAILRNIPKLINSGVIDQNGFPRDPGKLITLSHGIPAMGPSYALSWLLCGEEPKHQTAMFRYLCKCVTAMEGLDGTLNILCNSFQEIECRALELIDAVTPIGPLVDLERGVGRYETPSSFWREDDSFISWLEQHPPCSVIYVAFGSIAIFDKEQLDELALGLELSGRPFIWVRRPDLIANRSSAIYPDGFIERIAGRGRIVAWAPQREVLAHGSVACFLTPCGWNSTLEGMTFGVPMLCWPYFADQFPNQQYTVDVWKVGLGLEKDDRGMVTRVEIKEKLEAVIGDHGMRERVLELKHGGRKRALPGGVSFNNLNDFISTVKNIDGN